MNKSEATLYVKEHSNPLVGALIALQKNQSISSVMKNNKYYSEHSDSWGFARVCLQWDYHKKPFLTSVLCEEIRELLSDTDVSAYFSNGNIELTMPDYGNNAVKHLKNCCRENTVNRIALYKTFGPNVDKLVYNLREAKDSHGFAGIITNPITPKSKLRGFQYSPDIIVEGTSTVNSLYYTSHSNKENFLNEVEVIRSIAASHGYHEIFVPERKWKKNDSWMLYIMPPKSH